MSDVEKVLFEYKLFVCLEEISLQIDKPVDCTIKFQYDLFGPGETKYPTFTIAPDEKSHKIPGHFELTVRRKTEIEVKKYVEDNILKIQVCDNDEMIGTASVDLSPFFKKEVAVLPFGLQHREKVAIISNKPDKEMNIGYLYCKFILEEEECFTCKACNDNFKLSTILKHLGHPKNDCKKAYQEDELKAIRTKSEKRRKQKKHQRTRITYDCDKRASMHKKTYDPAKRAKMYQKEKEKPYDPEKEKARVIDKVEFEHRQTQKNAFMVKKAKEYFSRCSEVLDYSNFTEDAVESHEGVMADVNKVYTKVENQIKDFARKANGINLLNDLKQSHETYLGLIYNEWKIIFLQIEATFEEAADHLTEFNGYYGAWRDFGILQMPKSTPCLLKSPCKKCVKMSI